MASLIVKLGRAYEPTPYSRLSLSIYLDWELSGAYEPLHMTPVARDTAQVSLNIGMLNDIPVMVIQWGL